MSSAAHIVKIIGAWGFVVGFVVCLIVAPPMAITMAVGSAAFSLLPEN